MLFWYGKLLKIYLFSDPKCTVGQYCRIYVSTTKVANKIFSVLQLSKFKVLYIFSPVALLIFLLEPKVNTCFSLKWFHLYI